MPIEISIRTGLIGAALAITATAVLGFGHGGGGYIVVMRSTTSPFWEREIFVGNVTEYTMKNVSIDDRIFGVKAVDKDGNTSLVSAYIPRPRPALDIDTY